MSPLSAYATYKVKCARLVAVNTQTLVSELDKQIARLREARNLLAGTVSTRRRGRPAGKSVAPHKTRSLSPEARAKMAAAQKRRWAAYRKSQK
jgi:hypothetical protein